MKHLVFLLALAGPLHAELTATVQTTQGNVVVVLQYTKAPQAVANFMTLAQATRSRVHPSTGAVINDPMYIGEKFFRVVNQTGFKIAQTGSGTGTNSGGPGFTFKDEFDATLTHVPYVLSMANSGPNTNGSQIFFTGNVSIPSLDRVHTVFGLVTDPASRAVVDAIHTAGNDGTTITGITFNRTDAAAIAFNEQAQNLPQVTRPDGHLTVTPGVSTVWNCNQTMTTGAIFNAFRSTTLGSGTWSELTAAQLHVGIAPPASPPAVNTVQLDTAAAPRAFYNLTVSSHPGAVAPSTLANRTVTMDLEGGDVLQYMFNSTASGGTATYTPVSGAPLNFDFVMLDDQSGAHQITFIADNIGINPKYLRVKTGCDAATATEITGRHSTEYYTGDSQNPWSPFDTGAASITR